MRCSKILTLCFLLPCCHCFGQASDSSLLLKIYNGFPVNSSLDSIKLYCQSHDFKLGINVYDKTKTDFSGSISNCTALRHNPTGGFIESFYAYGYATNGAASTNSLVAILTIFYQDSIVDNAEKEYKYLVKFLKKSYPNSVKYYISSEHGKEGEGFAFYADKRIKLPLLTIELPFVKDNTPWKSQSIRITYVRPYPEKL